MCIRDRTRDGLKSCQIFDIIVSAPVLFLTHLFFLTGSLYCKAKKNTIKKRKVSKATNEFLQIFTRVQKRSREKTMRKNSIYFRIRFFHPILAKTTTVHCASAASIALASWSGHDVPLSLIHIFASILTKFCKDHSLHFLQSA